MAEEGTVEEQDSGQQEEASKMDRLKGRLKDLTGGGSDDERKGSEEDGSTQPADTSGDGEEREGEETKAEGDSGDETQAEGDSGESEDSESEGKPDDMVGDYKIDDVDTGKRADDENEARAQIRKLEKDGPPEKLADWPTGKAMYLSFGGAEGEEGYEDGPARQMGPSSTRHFADGSVEVQGEMADDPSDYTRDESVTEEAEQIGMDKSGKFSDQDSDDDSSDDEEGSSEEGSSEQEGSSADGNSQAEDTSSQSDEEAEDTSSQSDESGSAESSDGGADGQEQSEEHESTETS